MKKIAAFILTFFMLWTVIPPSFAAQYINDKEFYYYADSLYLKGGTGGSSLYGYGGSASVVLTGDTLKLQPLLIQGGKYEVWFYNMPWTNNYQYPVLSVKHKNGIFQTDKMDHKNGEKDFYLLGTYEFSAGSDGYVSISYPDGVTNATAGGYLRYNCVKFVMVEGYNEYIKVNIQDTVEEYHPMTKPLETKSVNLPEIKENAQRVYVSAGAQDGDGSQQKPFGTIKEAENDVKNRILTGYPADGIAIMIKGGIYELDDTLTLGSEDSGTKEAPVIYQAYDGEVILSTGKSFLGSQALAVTDPAVRGKFSSDAADKIKVIDLAAHGIEISKITPAKNEWTKVSLPDSLMIENEIYNISQYPNIGDVQLGMIQDASGRGSGEQIRDKGSSFSFKNLPRVLKWTQEPSIIANGKFSTLYQMESTMVSNIDTENMIISVLKGGTLYNIPKPSVIFRNLLCEIDRPGEFYVDRQNQKLYFYPIKEIAADTSILFNFLKKTAVRFDTGAQNIVFKGISIKMAGDNGVEFAEGSSGCMFTGGEIAYVTGSAAVIKGEGITLRDCNIHSIGATGVTCESGNSMLGEKGNVLIENNTITNVGTGGTTSMHGISLFGCGNMVRHNHIHDILGQGILWGGIGETMEYNLIERVCIRFTDAGAIYTASDFVQDSSIRYNIIRDVVSEDGGSTNRGIYFDNGTIGFVLAEGNIIKNVDCPFTFTGSRIIIKNNLIIMDDKVQQANIGSMILGGRLTQSNGKTPSENKFFAKYDVNALSQTYPDAADYVVNGNGDLITEKKALNNVFYNFKDASAYNKFMEETGRKEFRPNGGESVGNLFLTAQLKADDFSDVDWQGLQQQSGFLQIPVNEIGLYKGGMRTDDTLTYVKNRGADFELYYPENGAQGVENVTTLEWTNLYNISYSDTYVYIAEDESFTDNLKVYDLSENSLTLRFDPGTTYYWTVKATPTYCKGDKFNVGKVHSFTTKSYDEVLNQKIIEATTLLRNTVEGNEFLQYQSGAKTVLSQQIEEAKNESSGTVQQRYELLTAAVDRYLKSQSMNSKLATYLYEDFSNDIIGDRSLSFFMRNSVKDTPALVEYENAESNNKVTRLISDLRSTQTPYNVQTTFPNQSGYVEVYGSVKMETEGLSAAMQLLYPDIDIYTEYHSWEKKTGPMVIFSKDGKIYSNFAKDTPSMKYEVGRWYDVAIKADVASRMYSVYIDGELLASKVPFTGAEEECPNLGLLMFSESEGNNASRNTAKGSFCIDNLIVRAPQNYGFNNYLNSIKINGKMLADFQQDKYSYTVDLTAEEILNAVIETDCGDGARASVYDYNGKKCIGVISANQNDVKIYTIKPLR